MAGNSPVVGVLALQGDVREHLLILDQLSVEHREVRSVSDLDAVDALIIPGGESSVIDKLTRIFDVRDAIVARIRGGMPVFGTCAGLILLADRIVGGLDDQQTFGGLDVSVERNAFGSQVDSFETTIEMPVIGGEPVRSSFIRAPLVRDAGSADVIAQLPTGEIVGVRQGPLVGISFHPEISGDARVHDWWVRTIVAPAVQ